jgi:hypothetical protein
MEYSVYPVFVNREALMCLSLENSVSRKLGGFRQQIPRQASLSASSEYPDPLKRLI